MASIILHKNSWFFALNIIIKPPLSIAGTIFVLLYIINFKYQDYMLEQIDFGNRQVDIYKFL